MVKFADREKEHPPKWFFATDERPPLWVAFRDMMLLQGLFHIVHQQFTCKLQSTLTVVPPAISLNIADIRDLEFEYDIDTTQNSAATQDMALLDQSIPENQSLRSGLESLVNDIEQQGDHEDIDASEYRALEQVKQYIKTTDWIKLAGSIVDMAAQFYVSTLQ